MVVKFDLRSKSLAAGANTLDSTDAFPLPGPNGGTLVDFSVNLAGGQGPVLGILLIFRGGSSADTIVVKDEFTLRGTALSGALPDSFVLDREVKYPGASTLRVYLRNDTDSTIQWFARWAAEIA